MEIEIIFNRFEAFLWLLISAGITINAASRRFRKAPIPSYQSIAILAFALFGVSDIVESFTGAWWRPWWLFVMKAGCFGAFVFCYAALRRARDKR